MANQPIEPTKKPLTNKTVFNPTSDDLHFQWDSAGYVLKAGTEEKGWPDYIAVHAAKKLADKNVMTSDPDEHRVLMEAYLENSDPEIIAKRLGVNLGNIRKEAMTKEKEKARVLNLEADVLRMRAEMKELHDALAKEASKASEGPSPKKVSSKPKVKKVKSKK